MIKPLTNIDIYKDFIHDINSDANFHSPRRRTDGELCKRLTDAAERPGHFLLGAFEEDGRLAGLFAFLEEEGEDYLEMLEGLSRSRNAYEELLAYLKAEYPGHQADFVFNPGNAPLQEVLRAENAAFDTEQMKMVLEKEVPFESGRQVQLYSPRYREDYLAIHDDTGYWTGGRVLDAPERFRVILAVEEGRAVGYIDITYTYDENEPFDVFVKEEHRKKGYGKAMLAKAIELNRPHGMALQVDVDNAAAIALYKSMGFAPTPGENSITAHTSL